MIIKQLWRAAAAAGLSLPIFIGSANGQGLHDPDAHRFLPPPHQQVRPQPYYGTAPYHAPPVRPYYEPVTPYYQYRPAVPYWGSGLFLGFGFFDDYRYGQRHHDYRHRHRDHDRDRGHRRAHRDRDRDRDRGNSHRVDRIRPGNHPDPAAARLGINVGDGQAWDRGRAGNRPTTR